MSGTPSPSAPIDDPLDRILAEYLQAADSGQPPDQQAFIARYPQFAAELREFFASQEQFEVAARPFRFESIPADQATESDGSELENFLSADPTQNAHGNRDSSGDLTGSVAAPPGWRIRYFGEYELLEEIARGGMGVVFKARQVRLNRIVALKMILAGQFASAEDVKRFQVEARNAAQLDHPNIVPVYEVGKHKGQYYFTMKLVEGSSLSGRAGQFAKNHKAAVGMLATVARAVDYAHQHGILHRDIKPGNILIDKSGQPQVTDFGLARRLEADGGEASITLSGAIVGSPSYMAPEQARGEKGLTVAADVYGLGAVLYELLTGKPPFSGPSTLMVLEQVRTSAPPRPASINTAVGRDLEVICLKCLDKEPQRRYPSARALAEDLERWSRGEPIAARPAGGVERAWRWCRRKPTAAALVLVSTAAVVSLIVGLAVSNARISVHRLEAVAAAQREHAAKEHAQQEEAAAREIAAKLTREQAITKAALTREQLISCFRTIALADREVAAGRFAEAERLLEEIPAGDDWRGFEWHYLKHQCHGDLLTIRRTTGGINGVTFSPDGRLVSAGTGSPAAHGHPCDVLVWDANTGKEIWVLKGHDGGVFNTVFTKDSRRLLSSGNDGTVRYWDLTTGKGICTLGTIHKSPQVLYVALSPDEMLAAVGDMHGNVTLWDIASRAPVRTIKAHAGYVYSVAFSPDGKRVISSGQDSLAKVWDVASGELRLTLEGHKDGVFQATFSPDGTRIATGGGDHTVRVWNAASGQQTFLFVGHRDTVNRLTFSPDGASIASAAGGYSASGTGEVKVWDASTGAEHYALVGHPRGVIGVAFSPDASRLASASMDGTLKIWDAARGQQPVTYGQGDGENYGSRHFGLSEDGKLLAVPVRSHIDVWETANGRRVTSLPTVVDEVVLSANGKWLASGGHTSTIWNTDGWKQVYSADNSQWVLAFHPNSNQLVVTSLTERIGRVEVRDAASGAVVQTIQCASSAGAVTCATYTIDGDRLLLGCADGSVSIRDAVGGRELMHSAPRLGQVNSIVCSRDRRLFAWAGADGTAHVWDIRFNVELLVLRGYISEVNCVGFSPDSRRLVTGAGDRTVRVWDLQTGQELLVLHSNGPVSDVAFLPDGRQIISYASGMVTMWDARDVPGNSN